MEAQEAQPQARRMPDLGSGELTLHWQTRTILAKKIHQQLNATKSNLTNGCANQTCITTMTEPVGNSATDT